MATTFTITVRGTAESGDAVTAAAAELIEKLKALPGATVQAGSGVTTEQALVPGVPPVPGRRPLPPQVIAAREAAALAAAAKEPK